MIAGPLGPSHVMNGTSVRHRAQCLGLVRVQVRHPDKAPRSNLHLAVGAENLADLAIDSGGVLHG